MQNKQQTAAVAPNAAAPLKEGLHERNRHRGRYDFKQLTLACPDLAQFVSVNKYRDESIDFSNPAAVRSLNRAILRSDYHISGWNIPENYLCPPIPGRADYIHHIADLLGTCNNGAIPRGKSVRVLDIGVGANCVYPIIGHSEYGWSFLGVDIDPIALASAGKIVQANKQLADAVILRQQITPANIFRGLVKAEDRFDISICNPPFHASLAEAQTGTQRKWKNLGKVSNSKLSTKLPVLNFGGQGGELWCDGGEAAFIGRMIEESTQFPHHCRWFSTLVSREINLPGIYRALKSARVISSRTIDMAQGQKKSRIVAWTFLSVSEQNNWKKQVI
ncbi:MAG TPA: 23S rRNA (adenine(1618)-N(6))-methyltransferase RlmF [Gallionellaceae bacterium]|nr:23S rRNA (adenine(1618)-N(6))-methyltransferase RlmF [Gallionellaceae bacterium]